MVKELLFDDLVVDALRRDSELAAAYLNDVFETGDQQDVVSALRYLSRSGSHGAQDPVDAEEKAQSLFLALSAFAKPELKALSNALGLFGMKLAVVPMAKPGGEPAKG